MKALLVLKWTVYVIAALFLLGTADLNPLFYTEWYREAVESLLGMMSPGTAMLILGVSLVATLYLIIIELGNRLYNGNS